MRRTDPTTRRTVITLAAAVGAATSLAGCLGDEAEPAQPNADPADEEPEPETDQWDDVDGVTFETDVTVWVGTEPEPIDGEENPTLVLFDGREYTFRWENTDGLRHNVELWDENGEIVGEYATEPIEGEGTEQLLMFEATPAIAEYVCEPQQTTMRGDVDVVS